MASRPTAQATARTALARSRLLAQDLDDAAALLEIECVTGHVEHLAGNYDEARAHVARCTRSGGPPAWRMGSAMTGLGSDRSMRAYAAGRTTSIDALFRDIDLEL